MNNRQIALKLLLENLGVDPKIETQDDRKRVQKAIYIGQLSGVDLGYRFSWYLKGPYSPELTRDYYAMAEEIQAGDTSYENKELRPDYLQRLGKIRRFLDPKTGHDQSEWLELLASYHYLRQVSRKSHEEAVSIFQKQKPNLLPFIGVAQETFDEMIQ